MSPSGQRTDLFPGQTLQIMSLSEAQFGKVCWKHLLKDLSFLSSEFPSYETNLLPTQHPLSSLLYHSVGFRKQWELMWTWCPGAYWHTCIKSFVSDLWVSCLLPAFIKLGQPDSWAHKVKSQILDWFWHFPIKKLAGFSKKKLLKLSFFKISISCNPQSFWKTS